MILEPSYVDADLEDVMQITKDSDMLLLCPETIISGGGRVLCNAIRMMPIQAQARYTASLSASEIHEWFGQLHMKLQRVALFICGTPDTGINECIGLWGTHKMIQNQRVLSSCHVPLDAS